MTRLIEHPGRLILPVVVLLLALALVGPVTLLLLIVIGAESYALYRGQREVTGWGWTFLPRPILYVLIAPGIVLHELSHVLACIACGIRPEKVVWFSPNQDEDDHVVLGYVLYRETGVKRQTIIAAAPLWLLPLLLVLWSWLMLGGAVLTDPLAAVTDAPPLHLLLWALVTLSAGQAAFPSTDDLIPLDGGFVLGLVAVALLWLTGTLHLLALILLLPALSAAVVWLALRWMIHRKGLKLISSPVAGIPVRSERICVSCLHRSVESEERQCANCGGQQWYSASGTGFITEIPPTKEISCQSCERAKRRLYLRSFRAIYGEHKNPLIRRVGGYYCSACVRRRFWEAERRIIFGSGWRVRALLSKTLNLLLNIPARFAPPFNLAMAGAMNVEDIATEDGSPPVVAPLAPAWWVSLPRSDQQLLVAGVDYYAVLHVSKSASGSEIKSAYRRLVKVAHPDTGGSEEMIKPINQAYYVLQDQALRYAFDHLGEVAPEHRPPSA